MSIYRGDIFYVYPAYSVGSEQRSGRPAVIVSCEACNEHSPVVEVVYLTCQEKKTLPVHVEILSTGKRSVALCEQITSVDISRLGDRKGHVTAEELEAIDDALLRSLGITPKKSTESAKPIADDAALALIALRFLDNYLRGGDRKNLKISSEQLSCKA